MSIKEIYKKYESKLQKEAFDVPAFLEFAQEVSQQPGNQYEKEILAKIEKDYTGNIMELCRRYNEDIAYACKYSYRLDCENLSYEELIYIRDGEICRYEKFEERFQWLKELVKQYEDYMDVVMDLVSAKDRLEAIRVIMLEAEANLKKIV